MKYMIHNYCNEMHDSSKYESFAVHGRVGVDECSLDFK